MCRAPAGLPCRGQLLTSRFGRRTIVTQFLDDPEQRRLLFYVESKELVVVS